MNPTTETEKNGAISFPGSQEMIELYIQQVKSLINQQLDSYDGSVARLLKSFKSCEGKMLRPRLVLLSGSICGDITESHIKAAAIVEMIHNATLLHDDVIDQGQIRRGTATVNSLWGNESAVLLGDFILSRVLKMSTNLDRESNIIIADTTARVCQGEIAQIAQRGNWRLSEDQYIKIITDKSASLFAGCCQLGATLSGADEKQLQSLVKFGNDLGVAFQITDDLLDIFGNEKKMGKNISADVEKSEPTLAFLHLIDQAQQQDRESIIEMLSSPAKYASELRCMLKESGSFDYALEKAKKLLNEAIEQLEPFSDSASKQAMIDTARYIIKSVD